MRTHPLGGLSLLAAFNLLGAAGCGCVSAQSAQSPVASDKLLSAGSLLVTMAMLSAGLGLLVRRPWGWRIAVGAQLFAAGTQLFLASIGWSLANTAHAKGGDWVGFGVLAGQIIFIAGLLPAIVSVAGFFYLRRPLVRAAFHVITPPKIKHE